MKFPEGAGSRVYHRLVKRDAGEEGGEEPKETFKEKVEHFGEKVKDEFNKDVKLVADKTHMKPW